ncbi:MAG: NAD-dependent epimerase/dehydratase family protein [Sphingobacteriales bacterium]|nr:MAG: NAD-dependent epimerase/dehydratase family protein [Sphingobacteriales bacterium]
MKTYKVIITGATGMVGEGVLLHCLESPEIASVLVIGRRPVGRQHPKLKELILKDFNQLGMVAEPLSDYDACFYCAGISSIGMNEADYSFITYDTTINFAQALIELNPAMVFNFVSGLYTRTDGKQMWQRVKGKTEDKLMELGFRAQYNFRPGFMKPVKGQQNVRWFFKPLIALFPLILPGQSLTLHQVAKAMINTIDKGYPKPVLEIRDIKALAAK